MDATILAHGGQLTSDELAIMGGGIAFALLFPVVILAIVVRRGRSHATEADAEEGGFLGDEPVHGDLSSHDDYDLASDTGRQNSKERSR